MINAIHKTKPNWLLEQIMQMKKDFQEMPLWLRILTIAAVVSALYVIIPDGLFFTV